MAESVLNAETRTEFGKGAARRVRASGQVPAVLYGHGTDPVHLVLPGHETMLALRNSNALLELRFDDRSELALPKEVQRHPVKGYIYHADLLLVRRGEKVTVDVRVNTVGDVAGGAVLTLENPVLSVEAEATSLPSSFEIDVEGLDIGAVIAAGEITLPAGVTLVTDPETSVVVVSAPQAEVVAEPEGELGEEAAAEGAAPAGEAEDQDEG